MIPLFLFMLVLLLVLVSAVEFPVIYPQPRLLTVDGREVYSHRSGDEEESGERRKPADADFADGREAEGAAEGGEEVAHHVVAGCEKKVDVSDKEVWVEMLMGREGESV